MALTKVNSNLQSDYINYFLPFRTKFLTAT